MPTFCRHNRLLAECPICSKGTILDQSRSTSRRRPAAGGARRSASTAAAATRPSRGPFVAAGPYDGAEVRLERVPGGLRLAAWRGGQIERVAPVLEASDLPALVAEAAEQELLPAAPDAPLPDPGSFRASPGRTGELRDELRVETLPGGSVRIARWVMRPNRGWELQEAPVMLPPKRFMEAFAGRIRSGPAHQ